MAAMRRWSESSVRSVMVSDPPSGPAAGIGDELAGGETAGAVDERHAERGELLHGAEPSERHLGLDLRTDVRVGRPAGPQELGEVHEVGPDRVDLHAIA